jgi:imipenem/basic amino acid-specific outer membrane pore
MNIFKPHTMFLSIRCLLFFLLAVFSSLAMADQFAPRQSDAKGLTEEDTLSIIHRNFYFNRDFRNAPAGDQSYQEEWAQGILVDYISGYTQGEIGFGIDIHGRAGLKLDTGGGRNSQGVYVFPVDADNNAEDTFSETGGVIKLRFAATELKYGEMHPENPVFHLGDSFLLPEMATGFYLSSSDIPNLEFEAGHFTAYNNYASTNHNDELYVNYGEGRTGNAISFAGGFYAFNPFVTVGFYTSHYDETWNQNYGHLNLYFPTSETQSFNGEFNIYRTTDAGDSYQGDISNTTWSAAAGYTTGAHTFTLSYQTVNGDTPFDFVGYDSIYLSNAMQYSDFTAPQEKSYRAAYEVNLSQLGYEGLIVKIAYITGSQIDGRKADPEGGYAYYAFYGNGRGGKHWERDIVITYTLPSGAAKDLSFTLFHATHRANAAQGEGNIEEIQFRIEYPIDVL